MVPFCELVSNLPRSLSTFVLDMSYVLAAGKSIPEDLHLCASIGVCAGAWLIEAENKPCRVIELVMVEFRGHEGRVEGKLDLRREGRKLERLRLHLVLSSLFRNLRWCLK